MPTIDDRFLLRGGLKAALTSLNEVPLRREMVIELDNLFTTGEFSAKIGDGITHYNDLPYLKTGSTNAIESIIAGANVAVDTTDPANPVVSSLPGFVPIKGRKVNYAALPSSGNVSGDAYILDSDKLIYIWDGSWPAEGSGVASSALQPQPLNVYAGAGSKAYPSGVQTFLKAVVEGTSYLIPAFGSILATDKLYWRVYSTSTRNGWNETAIGELKFKDSSGTILTNPADASTKAFASSFGSAGVEADKAFDQTASTCWVSETAGSGVGVGQNAWLGWHFGATAEVASVAIMLGPNNGNLSEAPKNFTIESSPDGINWTVMRTLTGVAWSAPGQEQEWTL